MGETEGKFLRFYFEHGDIPCKGELIVTAPAPMGTQKEPYEDRFDPHVLAPGEQPGLKIELKDGATETFTYGPEGYAGGTQTASWTTIFGLDGAELWRIEVEGEEIDKTEPPIKNSQIQSKNKELPVALKYNWELVGEFTILGKGNARKYYYDSVSSARITSGMLFDQGDLYRWARSPCKETWQEGDLVGQSIGGKLSGEFVRLKWPDFHAEECYSFIPQKSYLGQQRFPRVFDSGEFMGYCSSLDLFLVDGQVITGAVSDRMKYKISLTKLD